MVSQVFDSHAAPHTPVAKRFAALEPLKLLGQEGAGGGRRPDARDERVMTGEGILTFWPALEDPAFTAAWTAWADERTSASERWWS